MNKSDLVKMLASQANVPPADAADELDRLVNNILRNLRRGVPVSLRGLGVLQPNRKSGIRFQPTPSVGDKK